MGTQTEDEEKVFKRWLSDYGPRAEAVAAALGEQFEAAMKLSTFDKSKSSLDISKSREYLRAQRDGFPFRILFFIYSSQFDEAVESQILEPRQLPTTPAGLTPREILARKASLLESNFKAFTLGADALANHYTVALSANESLRELPLVWEVPAEDEAKTGYPSDYMWQMTFRFLCEISHAIIAYGGYSAAFFEELTYIRKEPYLNERLLWFDQERRLFFPNNDQETWSLADMVQLLDKIA